MIIPAIIAILIQFILFRIGTAGVEGVGAEVAGVGVEIFLEYAQEIAKIKTIIIEIQIGTPKIVNIPTIKKANNIAVSFDILF